MFFLDSDAVQENISEIENKIGAFLVLISSFFIYNSMGKIDDNAINDAKFLIFLNNYIQKNEYGESM